MRIRFRNNCLTLIDLFCHPEPACPATPTRRVEGLRLGMLRQAQHDKTGVFRKLTVMYLLIKSQNFDPYTGMIYKQEFKSLNLHQPAHQRQKQPDPDKSADK